MLFSNREKPVKLPNNAPGIWTLIKANKLATACLSLATAYFSIIFTDDEGLSKGLAAFVAASLGAFGVGSFHNTYKAYIQLMQLYKRLKKTGKFDQKKWNDLEEFVKNAEYGCKQWGAKQAFEDLRKYEERMARENAKRETKK